MLTVSLYKFRVISTKILLPNISIWFVFIVVILTIQFISCMFPYSIIYRRQYVCTAFPSSVADLKDWTRGGFSQYLQYQVWNFIFERERGQGHFHFAKGNSTAKYSSQLENVQGAPRSRPCKQRSAWPT